MKTRKETLYLWKKALKALILNWRIAIIANQPSNNKNHT
jgi:hypothetical protein